MSTVTLSPASLDIYHGRSLPYRESSKLDYLNLPPCSGLCKTPPLCPAVCKTTLPSSTVCNKHAELPECCGFSLMEPSPPDLSFTVSVCCLHSLIAHVRSIPGAVQDRATYVLFSYMEHAFCISWIAMHLLKLCLKHPFPSEDPLTNPHLAVFLPCWWTLDSFTMLLRNFMYAFCYCNLFYASEYRNCNHGVAMWSSVPSQCPLQWHTWSKEVYIY